MKKNKLLRAMSLADDKYVDEANPAQKNQKNKAAAKRKLVIALAATLAVLTSLSLWLFIPLKDANTDVTQYADSEYYEIIQKLHPLIYRPQRYKNNFEKYVGRAFSNIFGAKMEAAVEDAGVVYYNSSSEGLYAGGSNGNGSVPESSTSTGTNTSNNQGYQEVTDNQVEGVIEADLIKRTDTHIFYLDVGATSLRSFSIDGENSKGVGYYDLRSNMPDDFQAHNKTEFYLSLDGKSITLILQHHENDTKRSLVYVQRIDVSDPANMKFVNSFCISGALTSTRMTNGEFLVLTSFYPRTDFSTPENFVPSIGDTQETMEALPIEKLYVPNELTNALYTVITRLDANTLEHKDSYSLLSYSSGAYVSADTIYTWRDLTDKEELGDGMENTIYRSEIVGISYTEPKMRLLGSIKIDGTIKDQYSLDAYKGILRVATTVNERKYQTEKRYGDTVSSLMLERIQNASLYCIDLSTWQTVASVERFAPDGETVRSVRFDGNNAYVCTAIQMTDPVFFFDLSDINNITYTDTGTISGFSTSLVDFAEGYLLGIGVGSGGSLKIEIYEEVNGKVVSVCKYEPPYTTYSNDYKSYYIDRENGLIGLGTSRVERDGDSYDMPVSKYTVLSFADRTLTEEFRVSLMGNHAHKRGVYVDGYFYMFGKNDFNVKKLDIEK